MYALRRALFGLALMFTIGCAAGDESQEVRFHVSVRDDQLQAQPGVSIEVDGQAVASTDTQGRASVSFHARANRARIAVRCPSGYHASEPRSIPLSRRGRQPPLELVFTCRPAQRTLLLVVRAPEGVGMPVLADGEALGHVAEDGTFHAVIKRAPDATLRLTLDTTDAPLLVPQHPVREITVGERDEIIVFDQELRAARPPRRVRQTSGKSSSATRHIPYAIGAARYSW
ncbi:MAG: hypothetical protein QM778_36515 [Myxococcales bacterium]